MKLLRRSIIIICILLLISSVLTVFANLPEGKYYNNKLKKLVKDGQATVIEVNKQIKIDKDTIYIERIINTSKETILRYKVVEETGWSFPTNALVLYDDLGKKQITSMDQNGKTWGDEGIISYDSVDRYSKTITIKLEWFDRVGEVVIPIKDGGK